MADVGFELKLEGPEIGPRLRGADEEPVGKLGPALLPAPTSPELPAPFAGIELLDGKLLDGKLLDGELLDGKLPDGKLAGWMPFGGWKLFD
jgi:hypothetical protein